MAKRNGKDADTQLTDRATRVAHTNVDRLSRQAAEVERKARATARLAAKKAQATRSDLQTQTNRKVDRVAEMVKNRPVMSAAIAAGAGLLALSVLRR